MERIEKDGTRCSTFLQKVTYLNSIIQKEHVSLFHVILVLVKGDKFGNFGERVFHPEMGYQIDDDKAKPLTSPPPAHLSQAEAGSLRNVCS